MRRPTLLHLPLALPLLLPALLAGCGEREPGVPPERLEARHTSAVAVCVARELLERARENERTVEEAAAAMPGAQGPLAFARTYREHAEVRLGYLVLTDSMLNAAGEDSARLDAKARAYRLSPPEPGTLEGNVAARYAEDFLAAVSNPDHRCRRGG